MNRSLVIPAVCSLFAFTGLLATLHGVGGGETATTPAPRSAPLRLENGAQPIAGADSSSEPRDGDGDRLLSSEEAEQMLTALSGEYLRPWRRWETSPHHLYSRVAPRPIPSISAKVELVQDVTCRNESFLLATITVSKGGEAQPIPCVVDRATKEVRLFAEGEWLSADEWVKKAPVPSPAMPRSKAGAGGGKG